MVREDIIAGLKNAVARGYSLQIAVQSYINAGYKKEEVEEAARYIEGRYSQPIQEQIKNPLQASAQPSQIQQTKTAQQQPGTSTQPQKSTAIQIQHPKPLPKETLPKTEEAKPKKGPMIFLMILLAVLVLILIAGAIGYFFFKEQLVEFFSNLFS